MKKTCPSALSISVVLGSKSRFKQAFSLMEMMIVLLIISIIAAATAPMVSKKMSGSIGTGESPWVYTNTQGSIAYNLARNDNMAAIIGNTRVPNGINTRMHIDVASGVNSRAISFGDGNNYLASLWVDENGAIGISNENLPTYDDTVALGMRQQINAEQNVVIGNDATANFNSVSVGFGAQAINGQYNVAVGQGATASADNTVAVGDHSTASAAGAVAVGQSSTASASNAVGVGRNSSASVNNAVAVGVASNASAVNAVALGSNATASESGAIAIGTTNVGGATGENSIAIGGGTTASGTRSVAIGTRFNANFPNEATATDTIAIGQARAIAEGATAIGQNAQAIGLRSVAIGRNCRALHNDSIIISAHAGGAGIQRNDTTGPNQVVLGTSADTVYIPGNLVVNGATILGWADSGNSGIGAGNGHPVFLRESGGNGDMILFGRARGSDSVFVDGGSGSGSVGSFGVVYENSDKRLKNVGNKYEAGLAELKKLNFYHYTFKSDKNKTPQVGVMAQDLQKVFPDAVTTDVYGYLRIRKDEMFYAVINAVKELDACLSELASKVRAYFDRTEKLEATVKAQQATIEELQKQNAEFEKRLAKLEKKACKE